MSLTLLLDMDNTLLTNSMETFVPVYLQSLTNYLAPYVDPDETARALMEGTQLMFQNQRPDCSLKEVFDAYFYSSLGINERDIREEIDRFYREEYPSLKECTQPNPDAIRTVEIAFERGYRVAIATNPIFPSTAITQRLEWAGLSPDDYPFAIIPSYETFHFAKPNPAYFAELLACLGWPEEPVLMVGDDFELDIKSAYELGISSFWIVNDGKSYSDDLIYTSGIGRVNQILNWIDETPVEELLPDFDNPSALLAILRSTPPVLRTINNKIDIQLWSTRQHAEDWCQTEIICHLRDVEIEVNLPRIKKVLQESNPFIPGMNTDPWAEERQYICQDGNQAFHRFMISRIRLLDLLSNLDENDWNRPARHAIFGPTNMQEIVRIIAGHDRLHIQQVHQLYQSLTRDDSGSTNSQFGLESRT